MNRQDHPSQDDGGIIHIPVPLQRGKQTTPMPILEPTPEPDYYHKCSDCKNYFDVRKYDSCPNCEEMK